MKAVQGRDDSSKSSGRHPDSKSRVEKIVSESPNDLNNIA